MIELTRLNGSTMVLNSDLIKTAEASPDTMLTLISGEKMIVREDCDEVVERVIAYRSRLLAAVAGRMGPWGDIRPVASLASLDLPEQPGSALRRSVPHDPAPSGPLPKQQPLRKPSPGQ
jgi:flagellar protein FlbD